MKINYLIALLFSLLLTSCASVNSYHHPKTGSQPLATVSGSAYRDGLFTWGNFLVESIDNQSVGMVWSESSKINVIPGTHLFVVTSRFNDGFGSGPFAAINEVSMTVQAGMQYRFVGKKQGASLLVWGEDSFGRRASAISSSKYGYAPRQSVYMTTIVHRH